MRVAIVSAQDPFARGAADRTALALKAELTRANHEADIVTLPLVTAQPLRVLDGMLQARLTDLSESAFRRIDHVIALRFPAQYVRHDSLACWLLELEPEPAHASDEAWRRVVGEARQWDRDALASARSVFTGTEHARIALANRTDAAVAVLYPPPPALSELRCEEFAAYLFWPDPAGSGSRLFLDALRRTKERFDVHYVASDATAELALVAERLGVAGRLRAVDATQAALFSRCFAVYEGGRALRNVEVTLSAQFCGKAVVCHTDAGAPIELIADGKTGAVCEPEVEALAQALDALFSDAKRARILGHAARQQVDDKRISWKTALASVLP